MGIKTRTPKQVWSHYNKLKYYFKKKFENQNREKDEFYLSLMDKLQTEEAERSLENESFIQFSDEMTSAKILISTTILEFLIKSQSYKSKFETSTFKLDENIIKTIVKKKIFYDAMIKVIEREIITADGKFTEKSRSNPSKTTQDCENSKNVNCLWPFIDDYSSPGCQTPKHVNYSIFEKIENCLGSKSKSEEINIKELNSLDYNFMGNSYFTEENLSIYDGDKKILIDEPENMDLSEQMRKLLNKKEFSSYENFDL